jgi:predicted nucleic acid-binding protein
VVGHGWQAERALLPVHTAGLLATADNEVAHELHKATPLGNKAAWAVYEEAREDNRTGWAEEPRGLEPVWKKFSSDPRPSPNFWMDPYLAAFAIAGGYKLVTADQGFKQFKNLDLVLIQ